MRKITKRSKALPRTVRGLKEGNVLWEKFRELGETRSREFRHLLAGNKIPLTTFYSDTRREKDLSRLPWKRALVYQAFFTGLDWSQLVPLVKPEAMTEREEKQHRQQALAGRLGLNRS